MKNKANPNTLILSYTWKKNASQKPRSHSPSPTPLYTQQHSYCKRPCHHQPPSFPSLTHTLQLHTPPTTPHSRGQHTDGAEEKLGITKILVARVRRSVIISQEYTVTTKKTHMLWRRRRREDHLQTHSRIHLPITRWNSLPIISFICFHSIVDLTFLSHCKAFITYLEHDSYCKA